MIRNAFLGARGVPPSEAGSMAGSKTPNPELEEIENIVFPAIEQSSEYQSRANSALALIDTGSPNPLVQNAVITVQSVLHLLAGETDSGKIRTLQNTAFAALQTLTKSARVKPSASQEDLDSAVENVRSCMNSPQGTRFMPIIEEKQVQFSQFQEHLKLVLDAVQNPERGGYIKSSLKVSAALSALETIQESLELASNEPMKKRFMAMAEKHLIDLSKAALPKEGVSPEELANLISYTKRLIIK